MPDDLMRTDSVAVPVLEAPPSDVQALLRAVDISVDASSVYFDGQLAAALRQAQQQWPALWRMTFGGA